MPEINPFTITPDEGLNRLQAYFFCTLMKAGYRLDGVAVNQLVQLAGGVRAERFDRLAPGIPSTWLCLWPDNSVVVLVNGTTAWPQYLQQYLGAAFQVVDGSPGKVNAFNAIAAVGIENAIRGVLAALGPPNRTYVGHSLGGAVAALLAQRGIPGGPVNGVFTAGQPRVGDLVWALGYNRPYQRMTTTGDPVPMLPPSRNSFLDIAFFPFISPVPASYRHAGFRYHVLMDGSTLVPPEANSWDEGTTYLLSVVVGANTWTGSHDPLTYACRLRSGIPTGWKVAHADYPGCEKIDQVFENLNDGNPCRMAPPTVEESPQPEVPDSLFSSEGVCG